MDHLLGVVEELRRLPAETEWAEFKENMESPQEIGEMVSALSNSAALAGKRKGFLLWGIDDDSHEIVGTSFRPSTKKVGGEVFENWLLRALSPKISFRFNEVTVAGKAVVLLEVERTFRNPVRFKNEAFIRIGSTKKKLKDVPALERELWRALDETPFELGIAAARVEPDGVLKLLDYPAYFDLTKRPLPEGRGGILQGLMDEDLIRQDGGGYWSITNLGAVLFARKFSAFRVLRRKAVRVVEYKGTTRVETIREQEGERGYAGGFEGLIDYINGRLPSSEVMEQAIRRTVPMYPELAIRELVANALIHQDFLVTGAGPMVEIFEDRIEITNPGKPLVKTERFLDTPPRSRNEAIASLMRRMGICEERGSGIDKVVFQTEYYQLPAPIFETAGNNTRTTLLAPRPLKEMDKEDRIRACYLHACLKFVNREYLTNSSLRSRFGIEKKNIAMASRLIREAVESGLIRPYDPEAAPRYMKYVPFWAKEEELS